MSDVHDELEQRLGVLLRTTDPVPELVTEAAKAAIGWRRLDAELAELLSDSALETDALALARSTEAAVRSVTFRAGRRTIDIDIQAQGEDRLLLGQIAPAVVMDVEAQRSDGITLAEARSDALGRFRLVVPAGTLRLRASGETAPPIETAWIPV